MVRYKILRLALNAFKIHKYNFKPTSLTEVQTAMKIHKYHFKPTSLTEVQTTMLSIRTVTTPCTVYEFTSCIHLYFYIAPDKDILELWAFVCFSLVAAWRMHTIFIFILRKSNLCISVHTVVYVNVSQKHCIQNRFFSNTAIHLY